VKNVLKSVLHDMTQYKTLEFIIIKNNDDGRTIATGIDTNRGMMITADMGTFSEFDKMICLSNLNFLKKILDQEQIMGAKGKMELVEGESFTGEDIFTGIDFSGPRLSIKYSAVDPRVVQDKARNKKFPPTINEINSDIEFSVEDTLAEDFRQAVQLQKMMAIKEDALVYVKTVDGNLVFGFPYGKNGIDLVMRENIDENSIAMDLKFDSEKLERAFVSLMNRAEGKILLGASFMDIKYKDEDVAYHIRLPKKSVAKKL